MYMSLKLIWSEKGDRFGRKIERVIIDKEQNVEIDDKFDFWLAEQILKKRLGKKMMYSKNYRDFI